MFTPGKWIAVQCPSGWIDIRPSGDDYYGLPIGAVQGHYPETNEADARLIVASKDLHQAVIDLLPLAESSLGLKDPKVLAIRTILNQVRGQNQ
jgi:hypothetical protein